MAGRPNGSLSREPRDPELVLKIVSLRDSGLTYREISEQIGKSRQTPYLLYNRWQEWAREKMNGPTGSS